MRRFITALALALVAFPATALAMPDEPHGSGSPLTSRVAPIAPDQRAPDQRTSGAVPPRIAATGTDVAAPDQQASAPAPSSAPASGGSELDWSDAGIGAAVATGLFAVALAGGITVRRRRHRRAAALVG
jgi:hypothetical protein